jgi:hypothetical protein
MDEPNYVIRGVVENAISEEATDGAQLASGSPSQPTSKQVSTRQGHQSLTQSHPWNRIAITSTLSWIVTAPCLLTLRRGSRYSDWLRAGRPWGRSSSPCRVKNFLFSTSSRPALGPTQPRIQWVPGALSPRVKKPGREADHWPPTSAEVKKTWIYTSTPPYGFMA